MPARDDKIAAAVMAVSTAFGRTLEAHTRCVYRAGGPRLVDVVEREAAEAALAVEKAHFAALLLE